MSQRNNYPPNRQQRGYLTNRPTGSVASNNSSSSNFTRDRSRSDTPGDQNRMQQQAPAPTAATDPKDQKEDERKESESPATSSGGSADLEVAVSQGPASRPVDDPKSDAPVSDMRDSVTQRGSEVNGAPVASPAASSPQASSGQNNNGGRSYHNSGHSNWYNSGYRNSSGPNRRSNWVGQRTSGNMHRPSGSSHMPPLSSGYGSGARNRFSGPSAPTGPPASDYYGMSSYLLPPAPVLSMPSLSDASNAGLLPTPASAAAATSVPPAAYLPPCVCSSCLSQYYYYHALMTSSFVPSGLPPLILAQANSSVTAAEAGARQAASEAYASYQQQAAEVGLRPQNVLSPRPKATPVAAGPPAANTAVVYANPQTVAQLKPKPNESKAGLAPIALPAGVSGANNNGNKMTVPGVWETDGRPGEYHHTVPQQPTPQVSYWPHAAIPVAAPQPALDHSQLQQQQQQVHQQQQQSVAHQSVRFQYYPGIVNAQLMPHTIPDSQYVYQDAVLNPAAGPPAYISGFPRFQ